MQKCFRRRWWIDRWQIGRRRHLWVGDDARVRPTGDLTITQDKGKVKSMFLAGRQSLAILIGAVRGLAGVQAHRVGDAVDDHLCLGRRLAVSRVEVDQIGKKVVAKVSLL